MSDVQYSDAYEAVKTFHSHIGSQVRSYEEMLKDIRMMNFKVRPVNGNIASLDFSNIKLVDALWHLGKIDEFARDAFSRMPETELETFFRLMDEIKDGYQRRLSEIQVTRASLTNDPQSFEAEIFKDMQKPVN